MVGGRKECLSCRRTNKIFTQVAVLGRGRARNTKKKQGVIRESIHWFSNLQRSSTMDTTYKCAYCPARLATAQGLHSHIVQSKRCRATRARHEASIVDSDSDSSNSNTQLGRGMNTMQIDAPFDGLPSDYDSNSPPYVELDPPVDDPEPLEEERPTRESRRATVEDVEDEDVITKDSDSRFIEDFPRPAGLPHSADKTRSSNFERHLYEQKKAGDAPWAPFETEDEWELARWLMTSGVSQTKIDSFLKLNKVSYIF